MKTRVTQPQTVEERESIFRLRYDVYVAELGHAKLAHVDRERRMLVDDLDSTGHLFLAESEGRTIGTLRYNDATGFSEDFARRYGADRLGNAGLSEWIYVSRLMLSQDVRGRGALQPLLTTSFEHMLAHGYRCAMINCAPGLVRMYEQLGFRRHMESFVEPELGYRVPMMFLLRDAEHLEAVRSPLWTVLSREPAETWETPETVSRVLRAFAKHEEISEEEYWKQMATAIQQKDRGAFSLFDGFAEEEGRQMLRDWIVLPCRCGDAVARSGDVGDEMYLVLAGSFEVRSANGGAVLGTLGVGDVFGEVGFIAGLTRTADVMAVEDSEVLVITPLALRRAMANDPANAAHFLFNLARILGGRLSRSNDALASLPAFAGSTATETSIP